MFVEGINCDPAFAREEFINVKAQYGKTDGIQAYHGYLSFKEQNITPELAQKIGMEFARRVWGDRFQIVVATHLNTQHLHCHFVINGKRLQGEEKAWIKFRYVADEICREHGLYYEPKPEYVKPTSYYYQKLEREGMPTRYSILRKTIDEHLSQSRSISEFRYLLEENGLRYQFNPNRKYWTITPKGFDRPIRLYKLGENYTNDAIMKRLDENYHRMIIEKYSSKLERIPTMKGTSLENRIKKIGGLYGLYLHYCYKLGYFQKNHQMSPARIHYIFRDDWIKLDRIAEETRLLGREHISTLEQLSNYRSKVETEMVALIDERKSLRNTLRRKTDDKTFFEARGGISSINERLGTLRREIKLCDDIEERSEKINEKLTIALADEEKEKGHMIY